MREVGLKDFGRMFAALIEPRAVPEPAEPATSPSALKVPPPQGKRAPRRVRRLSLRAIEKQSGRRVAAITVAPDGSQTFAFGQPDTVPVEEKARALFEPRIVPKQKVVL
jgi:hypothetical protein